MPVISEHNPGLPCTCSYKKLQDGLWKVAVQVTPGCRTSLGDMTINGIDMSGAVTFDVHEE
jgi:hypothetical protein